MRSSSILAPALRSISCGATTLSRDRRGAIALITLLAFPVLAGFVGLGIDASVWYAARRDLQTAADAAAIAAAYEITSNPNGLTVAARNDAIRNGFDPNATGSLITVNRPPTSGANAGNTAAVEVIVQHQSNLFLSSLLFSQTVIVRARSVANTSIDDEFCVLGLDPTRDKAVDLSGNATATFNCGIAVNSNDSAALFAGGSVVASASSANVVGGINQQGNASFTTTEPAQTGSRPVDDPYIEPCLSG